MLKRLFQGSPDEVEGVKEETPPKGPVDITKAAKEEPPASERPPVTPARPAPVNMAARTPSFDQIYQSAAIKPLRMSYGILRVAEMAASPHLEGLSEDVKRPAILMALEAAGVQIEDVLQDAIVHQRALNDYEEVQRQKLLEFEEAKAAENRNVQAELDAITKKFMSRIQANLDEVASEQENARAWQKRKQQEIRRISDAAALCVPRETLSGNSNLAVVLERTASRK